MVKYIGKLLGALNANRSPGELAHAFSLGMLLAFVPKNNALWYILFVITLFLRIHKGAFLLTVLLGSLIVPFADPLFDRIGYAVLTFAPMEQWYRAMLDVPFVAFTRFNNTIVAGALVSGIVLYVPFYMSARLFIKVWRRRIQPAIAESAALKVLMRIPLLNKLVSVKESASFFKDR